jgi:hypothetical protein
MIDEQQLLRAVLRTESAYEYYIKHKRYHQAIRIYQANRTLYDFLCMYSLDCNEEILDLVFDYIFHLEDWFAQFKRLKKTNPRLEDSFEFEKLENSISYPKDFKHFLKSY